MYVHIVHFFNMLERVIPYAVQAMKRSYREVRHGKLSVGLKIHVLKNTERFSTLIESLEGGIDTIERNYYRRTGDTLCLVLPPVGNVESALKLLSCIQSYTGVQLFKNPDIQIQICSPGRLSNEYAGLLTLGFYLGSDELREYNLKELTTTFSRYSNDPSYERGRRITIYDGRGALDRNFEWWGSRWGPHIIQPELPFVHERTDVLTCTSEVDVRNVNLIATLLVHAGAEGYWQALGEQFVEEMETLLQKHQLKGYLSSVPWIHSGEGKANDHMYESALREVMSYACEEARRLEGLRKAFWRPRREKTTGILYEIKWLLEAYNIEILAQSEVLNYN